MPSRRKKNATKKRTPKSAGTPRRATDGPVLQPWHARMGQRLYHAFIPHPGNDHQPHALRPRSLVSIAVAVVAIKVLVTGLLFAIYPTPGFFSSATVERFLTLTNSERTTAGLEPLTVSSKLAAAAEAKATDILQYDYFAHTTPSGKKFFQWIQDQGYRYSTAGENLALDFADADVAHNTLMASSGHKANILSEKYQQIGLAVQSGTFDGRQTNVLVQLFAAPVKVQSRPIASAEEKPATEPGQGNNQQPAANLPPTANNPPPPPQVPTFRAESPAQNYKEFSLTVGDHAVLTAEFTNTGTITWTREGPNAVTLDTAAPSGRESALAADGWPSSTRAALLAPAEVAPGQTGRWIFTIAAPAVTGVYAERFHLALSDGSVISNADVTFTVSVEPPVVEPIPTAPIASAQEPPAPGELTSEDLSPTGELQQVIDAPVASANQVPVSLATVVRGAVATSNMLFMVLIGFLTVALLVAVFVRYEIQHHHIVAGTILLIVLTAGLLVAGVHFLNLGPLAEPQVAATSTMLP
ncbi:MAG: hypothetical protein HYZ09_03830 [Candidatus Kerfeldbacteria bacterium]|nr:hypothetical protein [Candidatus Kerfeldbacteria bacterium]